MTSLVRRIVKAGRRTEWSWRYAFNLAPTLAYRFAGGRPPSGEAARVLSDLNRRGVAITSTRALLTPDHCYAELERAVERLEGDMSDHLAAGRAEARRGAIGQKTFNVELLGSRPELDPDSIYARFAMQQSVLHIANAYFGMYTRLRYYNVWHTFATQGPARESQLWHRDREDHFILKVFVYLSEVDEGAGPFTYAAGSHPKGKLRREPAYVLEEGVRRSEDRQMAEVVSPRQWVKGTGPKGTIIFADTRGYHKGGQARERDRIMYTCMFTSRASQSKELFTLPDGAAPSPDREQSFALSAPR